MLYFFFSCLGVTMSIVSASVQMCKAIRDLVYDVSNSRHRERIRLCVDSVDKASSKLRDLLLTYEFEKKSILRVQNPPTLALSTSFSSMSSLDTSASVADVHSLSD